MILSRRAFILLPVLAVCLVSGERVPVNDAELNAFATEYNTYVSGLRAGKIMLEVWARVKKYWRRMTGTD